MIPRDYITEWRGEAPWVQDFQVEQDLAISRALVEMYSHPVLRDALALRGGTALYKLHLKPAARYSEDIDLVQTRAEPAGPMMEALRATDGFFDHFRITFDPETSPPGLEIDRVKRLNRAAGPSGHESGHTTGHRGRCPACI